MQPSQEDAPTCMLIFCDIYVFSTAEFYASCSSIAYRQSSKAGAVQHAAYTRTEHVLSVPVDFLSFPAVLFPASAAHAERTKRTNA